jgi:hypothetical protein
MAKGEKGKAAAKADLPAIAETKADSGSSKTDSSKRYSRGENQKPVSRAYRDNWSAIFGKKKR